MKQTNYERISIHVSNKNTMDAVYQFKMYLDEILEECELIEYYFEGDGQRLKNHHDIEEYQNINVVIEYYPTNDNQGYLFYEKFCLNFSKQDLRLFIKTSEEIPHYYTYNGKQLVYLNFSTFETIPIQYYEFEAQPYSVIFEIPVSQNHQKFEALLKQWIEIGSVFYEYCVNEEIHEGYKSYLVEPVYHMNRRQLEKMIDLYMELVDMVISSNGHMISVQPLLLSKNRNADIILKIERNHLGIWQSEPFFKPVFS